MVKVEQVHNSIVAEHVLERGFLDARRTQTDC